MFFWGDKINKSAIKVKKNTGTDLLRVAYHNSYILMHRYERLKSGQISVVSRSVPAIHQHN